MCRQAESLYSCLLTDASARFTDQFGKVLHARKYSSHSRGLLPVLSPCSAACTDAGLWPVPCAVAHIGGKPIGGTPVAADNAQLGVHCRFFRWLKPGGKLLISDYCKGPGEPSDSFAAYIKQRGYDLHTPEAYGKLLERAGFTQVKAEDRTWQVGVTKVQLLCLTGFQDRVVGQQQGLVESWRAGLLLSNCLFLAESGTC